MKKLKLLIITRDFSRHMERSFYYFQQELLAYADIALYHKDDDISFILKHLPFEPDFILLNDLRDTHCPRIEGLSRLSVPWGIIMHDLHFNIKERKAFIRHHRVPVIFSMYRNAFIQLYPEFISKMRWLPHFAHASIFRDYREAKSIEVLLMGYVERKYYPLRLQMLDHYRGRTGFVYHEHPGYVHFQNQTNAWIGENYAKEINRSKIFLSCDSILHYPLRKYFEIPACNTLLLAPSNQDLLDLGFEPGKHFDSISEDDFRDKVDFYAAPRNQAIVTKIARQGFEFVHRHHTSAVRAAEFIRMIQSIIRSGS
ncbi:glycosyltransferase family 1 protein [Paenibacillus lycopersici]|uniref:Glycosyltransferase family 1 protein n=1 Tax=Paenibacillus lycopersici TaxID=2704462 RepID=A0A6C0FZW6_9BACL|nr:glycosyltransferase [Paenibacillus lycopersici]QHT62177.1 glycosyltransferase family 1 protein [Paenibacillus lycopersici]